VKLKSILVIFLVNVTSIALAQKSLSIATDFNALHNFRKSQEFWAFGPSFHAVFHLNPKTAAVVSFGFFSYGKFKNNLNATAFQPTTIPQQVIFTNTSKMRLNHFSIGWRNFLKGQTNTKHDWNLYTNLGLGLLSATVLNDFSPMPDTANYQVPVLPGRGEFKRLTLDVAIGVDIHLISDMYFYSEMKSFIPTSSYPSKYLLVNTDAPFPALLSGGFRIMF
jgi:hypothetical protein